MVLDANGRRERYKQVYEPVILQLDRHSRDDDESPKLTRTQRPDVLAILLAALAALTSEITDPWPSEGARSRC
jgi:hypothetical protein